MIRSGKKKYVYMSDKNSLKTPKMQSESANRRTDNTMARRERKERTNNELQNTTQKTKD